MEILGTFWGGRGNEDFGSFGKLGHRELGKEAELDSKDLEALHVSRQIQLAGAELRD